MTVKSLYCKFNINIQRDGALNLPSGFQIASKVKNVFSDLLKDQRKT